MSRKPDVTRPSRKPDAVDIIAAIWMLVALTGAVIIWVAQGIYLDGETTDDSFWGALALGLAAPIGAYLIRAFCSNTEKEPRE